MRDPVNALAGFGRAAGGEIVRINLGPLRPYLVSHPDHVQRVLRDNWRNYTRDGMFWEPVRRLAGSSIFTEESWDLSRRILQPLFTARHMASLTGALAETIDAGVAALEPHARAGRPVEASAEMAAIVARAVNRVLFGSRISQADAERLSPAYTIAGSSFGPRLLMPFMPYAVPMPGDRAFRQAVNTIDEVMYPLIRRSRAEHGDGGDVISALCRATDEDGKPLSDRRIRDDLVGVYAAASETTAMALTWLWPTLEAHPEVARRMVDEIDEVVGVGPVNATSLPGLRYTKAVLQELLRLYPAGWIFPRRAVADDDLGGVRIKAGAQVLLSPFVTHRLEEFWDRPEVFDPERFTAEPGERRHRWSYIPFGGGSRQCLGVHLYYIEAPLIVAAILSRFRTSVVSTGPYTPVPAAATHPRPSVRLTLSIRERI
ncbi:cytochrome P450 [Acrocarpospora phusangensis]|uniref:cytochrome P450 n=1 Tax=Acrocarpospora phusangensis TaxID=1070424 RepID=UPI001950C46A|nr:cytochrome P450 [Acrocarpospora phusangensis]